MVEKKCFAMFCQNCQFFGCTPRLNQAIKLIGGDFLIFFSDSVSKSLKVTLLIFFLKFLFLTLIQNCRIQEIKLTKNALLFIFNVFFHISNSN